MPLLYLIEILHQTTTYNILLYPLLELYLIEILHQTTTADSPQDRSFCCILSKFYIKPQPGRKISEHPLGCILSKFYIKPQQTRSHKNAFGVVSYRNSTSNHNSSRPPPDRNRVVSYRNSTSNHNAAPLLHLAGLVVSYRNSTSNHNHEHLLFRRGLVVSYRNSTSNHNRLLLTFLPPLVVSYRNSTSNHNMRKVRRLSASLYLIEILHQTTTGGRKVFERTCCILSKFYIKPQRRASY